MKRLLSVLLTVILLLTLSGCAQESGPANSRAESTVLVELTPASKSTAAGKPTAPTAPPRERETIQHDWDGEGMLYPYALDAGIIDNNAFVFEQGLLVKEGTYMQYADFATGQVVPFCFKPTCQHNNAECSAYVFTRSNFVANNKFWRFAGSSQTYYDTEKNVFFPQTSLYVSTLGQNEEKKIGTILGQDYSFHVIFYGNSAFVFGKAEYVDVSGANTTRTSSGAVYLTEIDLVKEEIKQQILICEGASCFAVPVCAYNGDIYIYCWYWEDEEKYLEGTVDSVIDTELGMELINDQVFCYYRYDIETGALEERADGYPDEYPGPVARLGANQFSPWMILGDWAVYRDGALMARNLKTGEVRTICDHEVYCLSNNALNPADQTKPVLYYCANETDSFIYRYDFETNETTVISLSNGDFTIYSVYQETDEYIYAQLVNWGEKTLENFVRVDISNGYGNCQWEKLTEVTNSNVFPFTVEAE